MKDLKFILTMGLAYFSLVYFSLGYFVSKDINTCQLGGVRSESTGFYTEQEENIAIGTSTNLIGDLVIESHSTSTLELRGDKSATTTGACLKLDHSSGVPIYFIPELDGTFTGSTSDVCNL